MISYSNLLFYNLLNNFLCCILKSTIIFLVGEYWSNKLQYIPSLSPQIPDSPEHYYPCPVGPRDRGLPGSGPRMEDYFRGMNY